MRDIIVSVFMTGYMVKSATSKDHTQSVIRFVKERVVVVVVVEAGTEKSRKLADHIAAHEGSPDAR